MLRNVSLLLALCVGIMPARGDEPKAVPVPYRLTDTQHVMVRLKLNGAGPFNFIVDTGCPVLIVSKEAAAKAKLKVDKSWSVLDTLDFEGGLQQTKVPARIETPFQIEGMNAMGLPGVELHGLLGYTVIAKYKMEFDFTRDRMLWTPLKFNPPNPEAVKMKAGSSSSLDMMGSLMKMMSFLSGLKPGPDPEPRGFWGVELEGNKDAVVVRKVLAKSPAENIGLEVGDRILTVDGNDIKTIDDVHKAAATVRSGGTIPVTIQRKTERIQKQLTLQPGL